MSVLKLIFVMWIIIGIIVTSMYKSKAGIRSVNVTDSIITILGDVFGQVFIIFFWPLVVKKALSKRKEL